MLQPSVFIGDPDLLKLILVKDFDHFTDRRNFLSGHEDDRAMNEMLVAKNGNEWKDLRSIMSPTFTSGKMKGMFPLVCGKANALVSSLCGEARVKPSINLKEICGRFTMDTIASCAFGIECNSLDTDDAEFPKNASVFFFTKFTVMKIIKLVLMTAFPTLFQILKIRLNPAEVDFFTRVVKETIAMRRKGEKRGDFLDLMLEARPNFDDEKKRGMSSIITQNYGIF